MTKIVVRAFTAGGYHRDIVIADEIQVHQHDIKVAAPSDSAMTGLIGHGGQINVADFPEVVRFELVIRDT